HLDYQAQLKYKEQAVKDAIRRIAKLDESIVLPIMGCDHQYTYRNKLEYSFSTKRWVTTDEAATEETIDQPGALGFHRPGSFDKIVDIHECLLQDDLTNKIRNRIREYAHQNQLPFYHTREHSGLLRNMIIRNTTIGEWMVIMIFGYDEPDTILPLMEMLDSEFKEITSLHYIINTKVNDTIYDLDVTNYKGSPYIVEQLGNVKYKIGPKSFFQTNPRQAIRLFDTAMQYAELNPSDNLYDLYTGLGSIALYAAANVAHVTGIEEIPEAIDDANINKSFNGIENATFYAGDVRLLLNDDFIAKHGRADVVITDPPRSGMHEDVVRTLLELEAPRLVYISCNPSTQARDLALLKEKYIIVAVQPVDMFPHTHHIESVAQLKLK
ncbi:MAG: 23S rRNA (uracil(1939)-C(5))-methyltransferase RlmD, partial [Saprospiraceae bacterium]